MPSTCSIPSPTVIGYSDRPVSFAPALKLIFHINCRLTCTLPLDSKAKRARRWDLCREAQDALATLLRPSFDQQVINNKNVCGKDVVSTPTKKEIRLWIRGT